MTSLRAERIAFAFSDAVPLFKDTTLHLGRGWTGLVGANGSGKTTLLRLLAGELIPDRGRIDVEPRHADILLCPQRIDVAGPAVTALATRDDRRAHRIRGMLQLDHSVLERWECLSPGERKRWQVGAALAREPAILLMDEPTNHIDQHARTLLVDALRGYQRIGVLVSHDRSLLDELCTQTIRICEGRTTCYPGAYSEARCRWQAQRERAIEDRSEAQRRGRVADRKLADARRKRDAAQRAMSGRHRDEKDRDARSAGAKTRRAWAEARLGKDVGKLRSARDRAYENVPKVDFEPDLGRSVFVDFAPSPARVLLSLQARELAAGSTVLLRDVSVQLERGDRVWLRGPNGAGKTTLVSALLERSRLNPDRVLFVRQELDGDRGPELVEQIRRLDRETRGRVLSLVAALGSDPARLIASREPSPGETRKLQLALGLGRLVWALILDEPTNHLDLPTIERLEKALLAYPGALLLVTHDHRLASGVTQSCWDIENGRIHAR